MRRSNPESFRGEILDCFASLAMTECEATARPPNRSLTRGHSFAASRRISPELCFIPHPRRKGAGKAGCRRAPAVCCAKGTRRKPHSSIQVSPYTRPSLRDGRTAYAVLSREPSSFWPPSPFELTMPSARLGSRTSPNRLDRSNDGQDHTVLPYAAHPASPRGFAGLWRRSSARGHGLTGTTRPARTISCRRCRVHRNPTRVSNDSRTAPLRRAGLLRCMPQFRISVKWNIFAERG